MATNDTYYSNCHLDLASFTLLVINNPAFPGFCLTPCTCTVAFLWTDIERGQP